MKEDKDEDTFLPKKKIKRDNEESSNGNHVEDMKEQVQIFCKCYSEKQINLILSALFGMQTYVKYIAIGIRHQQKSIQSLPKILKEMPQLKQLGQRVNLCIERAKVNHQFLNLIATNYSQFLHTNLKSHSFEDKNQEITPNSIIHIFIQIAKEWSNVSKQVKMPIIKIIELIKAHSKFYSTTYSQINEGKGPYIFVQGSSMGRIICELSSALNPQPVSIDACEERVINYLCGQYFLESFRKGKMNQQKKIYPFIHDFANKYKTIDAYQAITVPQSQNLFGQLYTNAQNKSQISVSLSHFEQQYSDNRYNDQWNVFISYQCTDRVGNVLKWIQIVYKGLKQGGLWILCFYSSFQKHAVPITYSQFLEILSKTQFKLLHNDQRQEDIIIDRGMTRQKIIIHYLVLQK